MGKKGKAQGRAGQKKKAQKSQNNTPKSKSFAQQAPRFILDDDDSHKLFRGFAGTANSPHSSFPRDLNVKFRHQAISFVSAGSNTPAESDRDTSARVTGGEEEDDDEEDDDDEDDDDDVIDFDEPFDDEGLQTNIITATEEEVPQGAMAHMHITSETLKDQSVDLQDTQVDAMEVDKSAPAQKAPTPEPEPLSFIIDTVGDPALNSKVKVPVKQHVARAPSPAPSDSSEEAVVFKGRNRARVVDDPVVKTPARATPKKNGTPQVTERLLAALATPQTPASISERAPKGWAAQTAASTSKQPESTDWEPAPAIPYWKKQSKKPRPDLDPSEDEKMAIDSAPPRVSKVMFQEQEKDTAEDTIAALQSDWKQTLREKKEARGGDTPAKPQATTRRGKRGRKRSNRELRNAAPSDDDEDDDSEAAYDDYMSNLAAQLESGDGDVDDLSFLAAMTKSELISGPSLVVNGKEYDEDELLPKDMDMDEDDDDDDSSSVDDEMIGQDIDEISEDELRRLNYSDLDSSELEEELDYDEDEQWEDEEDIRQRRIERMTDEQVARLFAKQEELGIRGNELIIDDGEFGSDDDLDGLDDGFGDLDDARTGLDQIAKSSFGKSANKSGGRKSGGKGGFSFPSATGLADTVEQYGENGFDIMDFERPSLRKLKKGRKSNGPAELDDLSDEDLKSEMLGAWENDRSKKRLKKAEREELRRQGLLGSIGKKGKADLSEKYLEGMNMNQIREELRIFLSNDGQQSRPFPPMDKKDRKALHEIASAFNLKSKSVGSGKNRFPVLNKTMRTAPFSDANFNRVMMKSNRGFLSNSSNGRPNKFTKGKAGPGGGGGFNAAAVSLRNGEVVGAGAAEIAKESFGHRLMEKMGWTKGTALGKDGEGMLTPVEQVMRTGKAGLG